MVITCATTGNNIALKLQTSEKGGRIMNSGNVSRIVLYVIAGLIVMAVASTTVDAYSNIMLSINQQTVEAADALLLNN